MKSYLVKLGLPTIVAIAATLSNTASALSTPCDASIADNIMPNMGCEVGSTNNDFLNPLQVNEDMLFGYTDWVFAEKDNDLDGSDEIAIDVGLTLEPKVQDEDPRIAGNWSLDASVWSMYDDVMIVLKGGNNNYVGYLVEDGAISGMYSTPFTNPNGQAQQISHVSVYVRDVPEPSSLALLALGLAGVGLSRRKLANRK